MTPEAVIAWRARLNLTQVGAAQALGLSRRQVQNFEAGAYPVPLTVRLAMAAVEAGLDEAG
jgi:DNA-binding XRE family transcriptional regulator